MSQSQPTGTLRLATLTALALLFLALFVRLGIWQLDRAAEKEQLQARMGQARASLLPAEVLFSNPQPSEYYRRLKITGRFLSEPVWLLDNRIREGRAGYEQFQAFQPQGFDSLMLVNRGWLAAPLAPSSGQTVTILAEVYPPPRPGLDLARDAVPEQRDGYQLLQRVDMAQLRPQLDRAWRPELFRLLPQSPEALDVRWPPVPVSADKHRAYAVQWFTMAAVLLLMVTGLWFRRKHEHTNTDDR